MGTQCYFILASRKSLIYMLSNLAVNASLKFHFHHIKPVNVVFIWINRIMSLPYVWTQNLRISRKAINSSIFPPRTFRISGQSKKTLSNNKIKCGKLLIGYSTNYATIEKYCKLINCSARWRLMTAPVVPFSNLLATVFLRNITVKKSRVCCNWCAYVVE